MPSFTTVVSFTSDLYRSCSPPAAVLTQAKKNHSQVLTTCQRCDVALRTRSMLVCLSQPSWTLPLPALIPDHRQFPRALHVDTHCLSFVLQSVAHTCPQHVLLFRQELPPLDASQRYLHISLAMIHVHLSSSPQVQALRVFALRHFSLQHLLYQLSPAWSTLPVLMIPLVAQAPSVPSHPTPRLIVRTSHVFVEFANFVPPQVCSLLVKVKPSVRHSVIVARNTTVALLVLSTRPTATVSLTRLSHLCLHTLHAHSRLDTATLAALVLLMALVFQLLVQDMDTTEHLSRI
jgi:hypothetical protein